MTCFAAGRWPRGRPRHATAASPCSSPTGFSTVRMADLVVVLDKGRVAEVGTHDDLIGRGGLYAEMYRLQASSYR
jgi:ATP-binding cassette subfamily B protein